MQNDHVLFIANKQLRKKVFPYFDPGCWFFIWANYCLS